MKTPAFVASILSLLLASGAGAAMLSQAEDPSAHLPAFDVVSIKPGKPGCVPVGIGGMTPGEFDAVCFPLRGIIAYAYGYDMLHDERIMGGPAWIDSANFDLEAKVSASDMDAYSKLNRSEIALILQPVLAERFHLKVHHETRDLPVYALVVAKSGLKIQEAKPGDPSNEPSGMPSLPSGIVRRKGKLIAWNSAIGGLAPFLRGELGRTVIDQTGLTGKYNFTLEWTQETMAAGNQASGVAEDSSGPSIFTALQEQLGLKLELEKKPQDVLVVDHVEQPSEN